MNSFERVLSKKLLLVPREAAPGFRLMVAHKGKMIADVDWGKTYTYYDLASLTKIIFTTTQWMGLESKKQALTNKKINVYLPWYQYDYKIEHLLSHTAGNDWWRPFYKTLASLSSLYEKKQSLRLQIRDLKPKWTKMSLYSDIDFFLLGFLLEEIKQTSLHNIWLKFIDEQLPRNEMHFNMGNVPMFVRSKYAPTEKCLWRKKILQGEVHDENTWALEGVSSHAGLFGRPQDVMSWGLWLRDALKNSNSYVDSRTVEKFTKRAVPGKYGDWSLGFMMPTPGKASCGAHFDLKSVGHTGFTGTSFWFDKKQDVIVVLLSNRIHPTRKNEIFRNERPHIHDLVMETLKGI